MINEDIFIDQWIKKLGLEKTKILINLAPEPNDPFCLQISKELNYRREVSSCFWNYNQNKWNIMYQYNPNEYIIVHELGHIYYWKKIKFKDNVKAFRNENSIVFDKRLLSFLDILTDLVTNYNLSKFDGFYDYFLKNEPAIKYSNRLIKDDSNLSLLRYFGMYIDLYIEFNFLFENNERSKYKKYYKKYLNQLTSIILKRAKKDNIKWYYQKFQKLNKLLDNFDKIKNSDNFKIIFNFMYRILLFLRIYSKEELLAFFNLRYGLKTLK